MFRLSIAVALLGLLLVTLSYLPGAGKLIPARWEVEKAPFSKADAVATGRALFLAKGCAMCHRHDGAGNETGIVGVGPDLTHYAPDRTFVREWLREPQAVRPTTTMPNLELGEDEIEALIAFLAAP